MNTFFITGAMGFVGFHLSKYLLERGKVVYGLDLGAKRPELLDYNNFHFIADTLKNEKILPPLVDKADVICHLAGIASPDQYVTQPRKVIDITASSGLSLLDLCRFKDKLVFFTSTSEIYGKNSKIPFKEDDDRVLGSTKTKRWCYSTSKALVEHYLDALAHDGSLDYITVRLFNVYGPHLSGRVVDKFLSDALAGQNLIVHGDGSQTRSFTYVDDVIDAFYQLLNNAACRQNVFNVGNPVEDSIIKLAETVQSKCNPSIGIDFKPHASCYGSSYEDIPRRVPDISKIQAATGWSPSTKLDEGLRKMYQFMSQSA